MTVKTILAGKGHEVITAAPDTTVAALSTLLIERGIGAALVTGGTGILGVVSERDVLRAIARDGAAALKRPIADYMTKLVATCAPDDTVNSVMERMTAGRFRHMPVLENGQLAGIVSIGDVVKFRIAEAVREAEQIRTYIATA